MFVLRSVFYVQLPRLSVSGVTSVEYGQIFHVTRIGKYYCKNMKYRINIYISREISIEHPSVGLASLAQLYIIIYIYIISRFHRHE